MRVGTARGTVWFAAALWLLASCVSAVAASGGEAERDRARPHDPSDTESERAAAIPSPGCKDVVRAPRIFVGFGEGMEFDLEGAGMEAQVILRSTAPGVCSFAQVHDPEGLREALAARTYEMTTVSFRGAEMTAADVYLEMAAGAPGEPTGGHPSKWRVGVERASDDAPWHVVSAVPAP